MRLGVGRGPPDEADDGADEPDDDGDDAHAVAPSATASAQATASDTSNRRLSGACVNRRLVREITCMTRSPWRPGAAHASRATGVFAINDKRGSPMWNALTLRRVRNGRKQKDRLENKEAADS